MIDIALNRRQAVVAATGGGLLVKQSITQGATVLDTILPPPPPPPPPPLTLEDRVRNADLIFVGTIQQFIFRGADLLKLPEELGKDYPDDNGMGNRSLHALVRVTSVLRNDLDFKIPKVVRMQRPVAHDHYRAQMRRKKIFLVKRVTLLDAGNPESRLFWPLVDALPIQDERAVRQIITKLNTQR